MDSVLYSLPDQASDQPFSIDAESGVLSTTYLDREVQDEYLVIVTAVDSGTRPCIVLTMTLTIY